MLWSNAVRIEVGGNGLSGTKAVNDSNWHHVEAVYDPFLTTKHDLYVDSPPTVSGNLSTTVNTTRSGLQIGERVDGINQFDGDIEEVRDWDTSGTYM